jgi:alkylation response protein AidB-like acyl-CoA dehydrogenase
MAPDEPQKLLARAQAYLQEFVAPRATAIDENPEALKAALQGLGDRALLALQVPKTWQGAAFDSANFYRFQELIAQYSGALAFLQSQHQSAGSLIARASNDSLKQEVLPSMATGEILIGVGFSQLRRPGEPTMKAIAFERGYHLEGEIPWVTGYRFFDHFILGATLPTGDAVYGLMPFREMTQPSGGTLRFSEPMQLVAMESTQTVSARVEGWFLPSDRVVALQSRDRLREKDQQNVLHHSFFALGCARAGLELLQTAYRQKQFPFLDRAYQSLNQELETCRRDIFQALQPQLDLFEHRLHLRAWAINLAGRCARAAITAASGAANAKSHAAGRIYRESLLFTVSGQTQAVMEATLEQLLRTCTQTRAESPPTDQSANIKKC